MKLKMRAVILPRQAVTAPETARLIREFHYATIQVWWKSWMRLVSPAGVIQTASAQRVKLNLNTC